MKINNLKKSEEAYKTIGEVAKELNLVDKNTGRLQTHTLRYWETQFKQIRPNVRAGGRRYYSVKTLKVIKYINFLLKEKGLTINGARKILNKPGRHSIDEDSNIGINMPDLNTSKIVKNRIKNIFKIINELKKLK